VRLPIAILAAWPVFAQLQVVQVEGNSETPIVSTFDFGAVAAGESRAVHFLVRNITGTSVTVTKLAAEGTGFTLPEDFSLPRIIAPSFAAPFALRFTPPGTATYLGRLRINDLVNELRGSGAASLTLEYVGGPTPQALTNNQTIDLGTITRHATLTAPFRLVNRTSIMLAADPPSLAGVDWRFDDAWSTSRTVQPGAAVPLTVVFQPNTAGVKQAVLHATSRDVTLRATVQELPVPKPALRLADAVLLSAREEKLTIHLEQPASDDVSGTIAMQFTPDAGLTDDRAIAFLPGLTRSVAFRIKAGSADADFSGAPSLSFQTGTTAGSVAFTVTLGANRVTETYILAQAVVSVDSARGLASDQSAEVIVQGFDNTRTIGKLAFTFYLKNGTQAAPGRIEVDASNPFQALFNSDRSAGGAFSLRVHFPVSGTASELAAVDVEFTNAKGTTPVQHLQW